MQLVAFLRALLDVPMLLTWVDSEERGVVCYVCPNHLTAELLVLYILKGRCVHVFIYSLHYQFRTDKTYNTSKNHSVLLKNFEIFTVNRITLQTFTRKVRNYASGYGMDFLGLSTTRSVFQAMSVDCVPNVDFEIMLKDVFVTKSWRN